MAIETYGNQKVKNEALPSVRYSTQATANNFGAGFGKQMEDVGEAGQKSALLMAKVARDQQDDKDTTVARDAFNRAFQEVNENTTDYLSRKGGNAVGVYSEAQKKFQEIAMKHSKNLTRDQKEKFDAALSSSINNSLSGIYKHQENEYIQHKKDTLSASSLQYQQQGIINRYNPEVRDKNKHDIVVNTAYVAKTMDGMDKAGWQNEVLKATTAFHTGIVDAMVSDAEQGMGSFATAKEYLEQNKGEIDPIKYNEKLTALNKQSNEAFVQSKIIELANSGMDIDQQVKSAEKAASDAGRMDLVDDLRDGVIKYNKDLDAIKKAKREESIKGEIRKIMANPVRYKIPTWVTDPEDFKTLTTVIDSAKKHKGQIAGVNFGEVQDSTAIKNEIQSLPAQKFLELDLTSPEYVNQLNAKDLGELIDLQEDARSKTGGKHFRVMTISQQASRAIAGFKDISDKTNSRAIDKANKFYQQFEQEVNRLPEEKRTSDEIDKITKRLLSPVSVRGAKYRFELPYLDAKVSEEYVTKELTKAYGGRVQRTGEGFVVESEDKNTRVVLDQLGRKVKTQKRNNNANKQ